jgi:hypothetical protein
MPKRRCVFTESLEAEYPFLKINKWGKCCAPFANHSFQQTTVVVSTYCNIPRKGNMQMLQKLKVAAKRQRLILPKRL